MEFKETHDLVGSILDRYDPRVTIIICGDANGVDASVYEQAIEREFRVFQYKAQWNKYGRAAGPMRNKLMVDRLDINDVVYCLPYESIRITSGTRNTWVQATQRGIKHIYVVPVGKTFIDEQVKPVNKWVQKTLVSN